ncbi:hypothetical protein MTO96_045185 [Rhipicephalus appendiculatus]
MLTLSLRDRELERPVDLDLLLDCDRPFEQERGLEPFRPRETDRPLSLEGSPVRARAVIFRQHPVAVASGLRTSGPPAGGRLERERCCTCGVVGFLGFLVALSSSSLPYDVWNLKSLAILAHGEVITPTKRTFRGAVVLFVRVGGATTSAYPVLRRWANISSVA